MNNPALIRYRFVDQDIGALLDQLTDWALSYQYLDGQLTVQGPLLSTQSDFIISYEPQSVEYIIED
jgi:hypothetical protein